jgi:D-alanyl-lipoteichoic acid acyltransferase DltB (MBOAT superfamily)
MLFSTFHFWIFFLCVFGVYGSLSHRWQNRFLLVASYFFYAWWDQAYAWWHPFHYRFAALMFCTSALDYFVGTKIAAASDQARKRRWLMLSLIADLSVLGFFKYCNFFADSVQTGLSALGLHVPQWQLQIILPVGISFYTFQSMAYTIDMYRGKVKPARSLLDYLLFISYFPHLVAGPINRPQSLLSQCEQPRRMTWDGWREGAALIVIGLFKKIAIADTLAPLADQAFSTPDHCTRSTLWIGLYAFTFQIYADFSGYTDIARGLARLMGFELMRNFDQPYFAANVTEFWRRWHISLSSWLRDYLYIPLGGSRHGAAKTYRNLFLTMFLGGLWHGASWTFALWGMLHGIYLAVHRHWIRHADSPQRRRDTETDQMTHAAPRNLASRVRYLASILLTFHLVALTWIFFRVGSATAAGIPSPGTSLARAWHYLAGLLPLGHRSLGADAVRLDADAVAQGFVAVVILILFVDLPQYLRRDHYVTLRWPLPARAFLFGLLCVWLLMMRETDSVPFIYFQF